MNTIKINSPSEKLRNTNKAIHDAPIKSHPIGKVRAQVQEHLSESNGLTYVISRKPFEYTQTEIHQ